MIYREEREKSKIYKEKYFEGILSIIESRQTEAEKIRREYVKNIFINQEEYRNNLKKMLGWPLVDYKAEGIPDVISEKLSQEDGYSIYRVQIEMLAGLWITGLFFKMDDDEKRPFVLVQHGGWGTPEIISGIYDETGNYNDMLQRVIKHGVNAFAPQLLLWSDDFGVVAERDKVDARLKRVGSSISAIEIFGLMRVMDYFETQDYVLNFGMVGMSYGGFYAMYTAATDTRIKAAITCAQFCKRDKWVACDWTWNRSAEMYDDAEVAALVYPRKLCIEVANRDGLFDWKYSQESFERLKEMCEDVGTEWIEFIVFDGEHEFNRDDEPVDELIKTLFR